MGLKAKLKVEDGGIFAASVFYAATGILFFTILTLTDPNLIHIGLIGIISLATAYGLFRRRFWALWSVSAVAIIATVFAFSMLYYIMGSDILTDVAVVVYLILTWISAIYVAVRRNKLEF